MKAALNRVLDNPPLMRRIAGWMIIASVAEWAVATATDLVSRVVYLSHLSQLTFTVSLIPWWQGLRVEARQVEQDLPGVMVQALIEQTTLEES